VGGGGATRPGVRAAAALLAPPPPPPLVGPAVAPRPGMRVTENKHASRHRSVAWLTRYRQVEMLMQTRVGGGEGGGASTSVECVSSTTSLPGPFAPPPPPPLDGPEDFLFFILSIFLTPEFPLRRPASGRGGNCFPMVSAPAPPSGCVGGREALEQSRVGRGVKEERRHVGWSCEPTIYYTRETLNRETENPKP